MRLQEVKYLLLKQGVSSLRPKDNTHMVPKPSEMQNKSYLNVNGVEIMMVTRVRLQVTIRGIRGTVE